MTINNSPSIHNFNSQQERVRSDFPEKIFDKINQSQNSKSLLLENEELQYLSSILNCCRDVEELTLVGNLESLPDTINNCHNLRKLDIRSNELLKHLPNTISQCRELKIINIYNAGVESLPDTIGNCHNLQELSIRHSKLKYLPDTIGNCKVLKILAIYDANLKNIPDTIGNCHNLEEINIENNQIEYLPENIGNCSNLKTLSFSYNNVKFLPHTISNCKKLTELHLNQNRIEHLPNVISNCTRLQLLNMIGNNWKSLVDIVLLLSTMTDLKVNGLPAFVISEKKSLHKFTANNEFSYDIVIVNPVAKGYGDYELGRKIQDLVTMLDYSVKIQMTTEELKEKLKSRLIIVTPYSFEDADTIQTYIKKNFFIDQSTKVLMIDEMDAIDNSESNIEAYKESFQKIAIDTVDEVKIGFSSDSIGYLSMTNEECEDIQQRSKVEIKKLFDSFNMTLDPSAEYYLSYLNSATKVTAMQVFIFNTLRELQGSPSSVNYICSLGETATLNTIITIAKKLSTLAKSSPDSFSEDAAKKLSKINLMIVDVQNKKISQKELVTIGKGIIPINIIFLSTMNMPKRVWHNFITVSKSGMMTGDQSLTDYLRLKREMPFYEAQYCAS